MKSFAIFCVMILTTQLNSCAQKNKVQVPSKKIGGSCEGCEAILESPLPFDKLSFIDTLPDFGEPGPRLVISGIIYRQDGRTPAKDVILYIYHTDQTGHYTNKYRDNNWAKRHGYIRGWVKTNEKGEYRFYTLRPAPYPGTNIPAHIHPVLQEPGKNEYYIDEFLFEGDPFLTASERKKQPGRGGNGIVRVKKSGGVEMVSRNIICGKNIPDY